MQGVEMESCGIGAHHRRLSGHRAKQVLLGRNQDTNSRLISIEQIQNFIPCLQAGTTLF